MKEIWMKWMKIKIGKYLLGDIINPVRWFKVLKWNLFPYVVIPREEITFRSEILIYRGIRCHEQQCMNNNECECCGCPFSAKAFDPSESCKDSNWNTVTLKQWEDYKKKFGLIFKYEFTRR